MHVTSGKTFDERRNTSQVRPVDPMIRVQLTRMLDRSKHEDWYRWIVNRRNGVHDHAAVRKDGSRAACPVAGCTAPLAP
jgi:hypothetical protein